MLQDCLFCTKILKNSSVLYCSNKCQAERYFEQYINDWKIGIKNGSRGINAKNISKYVQRYIEEKYNNQCSVCKWAVNHPLTGKPPLEIDHIDGNSDNNTEENLRLLCPNCHSLTSTHKNHNKGKGRSWRKLKYLKNATLAQR